MSTEGKRRREAKIRGKSRPLSHLCLRTTRLRFVVTPGPELGCLDKTNKICPLTAWDVITGKMDGIQQTGNVSLLGCSFELVPLNFLGSIPGLGMPNLGGCSFGCCLRCRIFIYRYFSNCGS